MPTESQVRKSLKTVTSPESMIATAGSVNDESRNLITPCSTFSAQGELHRDEGEQSSLASSSKSLRKLDNGKQIEYWKSRAIKAIHSNKELLKKNEKLEENLSDMERRADRFEKRAERLSRELHLILQNDGTRRDTFCTACGGHVVIRENSSNDTKIIESNGSDDSIPRDTVLEDLLRKSIRRKWESV
jgi:hypothetical protein